MHNKEKIMLKDNIGKDYETYYKKYIDNMVEYLNENSIDTTLIKKLVESGYFLLPGHDLIRDSLNGVNVNLNIIKSEDYINFQKKVEKVKVRSLKQAFEVIMNDKYLSYNYKEGLLSFRGQTREYFIERSFPNPCLSENGKERIIIPSAWRPYANLEKLNRRPVSPYSSTLDTIFGDQITYHGLDVAKIKKMNIDRYGVHSISDLEDFPEEYNQEYYRRYKLTKSGYYNNYVAALEQHYGFDTCGLDVTYNLSVAIFFATHKYKKNSKGKSEYIKLDSFSDSVIYAFRFRNPSVKKTQWLIDEIPLYTELNPIRPVKQECTLPFFHVEEFNNASTAIELIFEIDDEFDFSEIPTVRDLFPDRNEDLFYDMLLQMKDKHPEIYGDIPEYI